MLRLRRWQRLPLTMPIIQGKTGLLRAFPCSWSRRTHDVLIVFYFLSTVTVPNFVSVFHQLPNDCKYKETVRRTPSAPSSAVDTAITSGSVFPFGHVSSSGWAGYSLRGDVANDSGIWRCNDTLFPILFYIIIESQGHVTFIYRRNSADKLPEIGNDTRVETQYTKTKRKRS